NTSLVENSLKLAKQKGIQVSVDLASYNVVENQKDFLSRILPEYVDIVFANEEEAKAYTGKNPNDALDIIAEQCRIAVVKIGKEGSLIKSDGITTNIGVIPVKAVDTTGAGDQYAAGFLHGYMQNLSLEKCGKIGALLAGKVIENYGARIAPDLWKSVLLKTKEIINS
ncbi:MAG: adenosine kinase, partial [Bacteroidales bacterium]